MPRICGRTLSPIGTRHFRRFSWNNAKHFDFHETKRPAGTIIYGTQAPSNEASLSLCFFCFPYFSLTRGSRTERKNERDSSVSFSLSFFPPVEKRAGGFIRSVFAQLVASVTLFFSFFRPSS